MDLDMRKLTKSGAIFAFLKNLLSPEGLCTLQAEPSRTERCETKPGRASQCFFL